MTGRSIVRARSPIWSQPARRRGALKRPSSTGVASRPSSEGQVLVALQAAPELFLDAHDVRPPPRHGDGVAHARSEQDGQEPRVAQQVPPPRPAGFAHQAVQPLQSSEGHPGGRAPGRHRPRNPARHPRPPGPPMQRLAVLVDEQLLLGLPRATRTRWGRAAARRPTRGRRAEAATSMSMKGPSAPTANNLGYRAVMTRRASSATPGPPPRRYSANPRLPPRP